MPTRTEKPTDRYLELIGLFRLRPIKTEAENDRALGVVSGLLERDRECGLTKQERDYLDALVVLIERFERVAYPMSEPTAEGMLRFFLEDRQVSQTEVAKGTGIHPTTLSSLLAGRRTMTREHIEAVAGYFQVNPGLFFADPAKNFTRRKPAAG